MSLAIALDAPDALTDDVVGLWTDCPLCDADGPECALCDGVGGFTSDVLADPRLPSPHRRLQR